MVRRRKKQKRRQCHGWLERDHWPELERWPVGIDLGNSFSAIATIDKYCRPQHLPCSLGMPTLPSVVYVDDLGGKLVGEAARSAAEIEPERVVRDPKTHLRRNTVFSFDNVEYTAEQICGMIIDLLRRNAEMELNEEVTEAVIGVPVHFGLQERRALRAAAELAGFGSVCLLDEPIAIALAHGCWRHDRNEAWLVCDLGATHLSTSLMRIIPPELRGRTPEIEVLFTTNTDLGCIKWDKRIFEYVVERVMVERNYDLREDLELSHRVFARCGEAKQRLSRLDDCTILVESSQHGWLSAVGLNRAGLAAMTQHLQQEVINEVNDVLGATGRRTGDVDRVFLGGGGADLPMVRAMFRDEFRNRVTVCDQLSVAHGAAAFAFLLAAEARVASQQRQGLQALASQPRYAPTLRNVSPYALALSGATETGESRLLPLVAKGTTLPCSERVQFRIAHDCHTSFVIQLYECDARVANEVSDFDTARPIQEIVVDNLPSGLPAGEIIEVTVELSACYQLHIGIEVRGELCWSGP